LQSPAEFTGALAVVGIGPGSRDQMTARALKVIARADVVIGNETYLDQLEPLLIGKNVIRSSMGKEVERAKTAIKLAHIHRVAMISGGDAGVYGMAGIVLEVLEHEKIKIPVEIVPGVTAATAAASLVGSPLSGDFAVISLSDLLIPKDVIEKRLEAVFSVGIPVVLYNPKSRGRPQNFSDAISIARKYLDENVPVALVKDAYRPDEHVTITTLGDIDRYCEDVDMHTTVIIGGPESRIWRSGEDARGIITPRGYHRKYVY
jgi:precorrin-3B C17-methyltransferase